MIPSGPDFVIDWEALAVHLDPLRGCPQDPIHHAEGDVDLHTRMVLSWLTASPRFRTLDEQSRTIVFWACLLHDVAKPACTRTESDGRITARHHSVRGAISARQILWRAKLPFFAREAVCNLIRHHQIPFFLVEKEPLEARRRAIEISLSARCDHLALVAEADAQGRHCADQQKLLDHIELFRLLCEDARCLASPYPFVSAHARFHYLQRGGNDPDYRPHDQFRSEVVLLSGLPGSGKDHLARSEFADFHVVSLDRVREQLDVDPADHQAGVIAQARDEARVQLRAGGKLLWNATNLSRQLRGPLISLFTDYGARVRIVYIEVADATLHAQNRARESRVPAAVITKMLDRWEVPTVAEAHDVDWRVRY